MFLFGMHVKNCIINNHYDNQFLVCLYLTSRTCLDIKNTCFFVCRVALHMEIEKKSWKGRMFVAQENKAEWDLGT